LIPVGFGYGDGDEFFMRGWVWDSETHPRPTPLPSLDGTCDYGTEVQRSSVQSQSKRKELIIGEVQTGKPQKKEGVDI